MIPKTLEVSKSFSDLSINDVTGYGQKGVNCGLILQDLKAIKSQTTTSDLELLAVPGFVFHGNIYRRHIQENNLLPEIERILDSFNNNGLNQYECSAKIYSLFDQTKLSQEVKNEITQNRDLLIREVANILDISFEEVHESMSLYFRSNADIGEDGQIGDGLTLEEIREMIGAGKHESYGENYSLSDCFAAFKKVMASTFSPQACGQYKGQAGFTQKWLQMEVNMCVIQMVEVHSIDVGSALAFGEITGNWIDLNLGKNLQGDDLVGGENSGIAVSYHIPTQTIDYKSQPVEFLTDNTIKAIAQVAHLIGLKNNLIADTEWSFGGLIKGSLQFFAVAVQFRDYTPVQVEKKTTTLEVHEILSYPPEEFRLATGLASAKRCVVAPIIVSNQNSVPNTTGKILLAQHANPSFSGLISQTRGFIFETGALNCHMGLMTRGRRAAIFSAKLFHSFNENDIVTILGNQAFIGDWSKNFVVNFLDLLQCSSPVGTKAGFVDDGNNAFLGDLFPFFALGLSEGYDLLRMEANNTAHEIPSPLSFIHYDHLDLTTEGGLKTKEYIDNAMLALGTTNPQYAYRKLSVAKLARPMALCKKFGKICSVRLYGARLNEHDHFLKPGFLPEESDPMFGFNGILMYLEEWGQDVLKLSVQVLEDLRQMGYDNTELFIPNVATIQGLEMVLDLIKSWGFDPTKWDLKPMMETQEFCSTQNLLDLKKLADKYGFKKVKLSFGFNDFRNGTAGANIRAFTPKDGRGNLDSQRYTDQVNEIIQTGISIGIEFSSCGLPSRGMLSCMKNAGAKSVGLPPGHDFVEGLEVLNS